MAVLECTDVMQIKIQGGVSVVHAISLYIVPEKNKRTKANFSISIIPLF